MTNDDIVARIEAATGQGRVLTCVQCGRSSSGSARGWQVLLGYDLGEDDRPEAFVFCPECAEREFAEG